MQTPRHFTFNRRLFQAHFARQPQQINFVFQSRQQSVALALRPTRAFQFVKLQINPSVDFQNRNALGLRRMRRNRRTNIEVLQYPLNRLRRHVSFCGLSQRMRERTNHLIRPAFFFNLAAVAHGSVFFCDIHQLQPDADDLQGMFHQVVRNARSRIRIIQNGQDRWFSLPDHLPQQITQHVGQTLDIRGIFKNLGSLNVHGAITLPLEVRISDFVQRNMT